jgi:hypothetical protein
MWAFIGLSSLLGVVISIIAGIVSAIRKTGTAKKNFSISLALFLVFVAALFLDPSTPNSDISVDHTVDNTPANTDQTSSDVMVVSSTASEENTNHPAEVQKRFLTNLEIEEMYTNPKKFIGYQIEFYGQVFREPERDNKAVYLQAFGDPTNFEHNTMIAYPDPQFRVATNDYIHVIGTVHDEFKGENLFGGKLTIPLIWADEVSITDYITAVSPSLKTVEVNETIDQEGYVMTLQKVEFSEIETRVYLEITNNTKNKIYFYDFNSYMVQGTSQFDTTYNFYANYKEVRTELLPGIKSDGIVLFEPIDPTLGDVKFIAEGSSDNWQIEFTPFEFAIPTH